MQSFAERLIGLCRKRGEFACGLLLLCCASCTVWICVNAASAQSDNDSQPGAVTGHTFEGGVKGTAIPAAEGLDRIGAACGAISESTDRIMKEAARKDTIVVRGPNVIGNGIVLPPVGGVGGVMQFGDMPIHKDKLARWMSETQANLDALKTYTDGLIVPPTVDSSKAGEAYTTMGKALQSANLHMEILQSLSAAKRMNNERIHSEALAIHRAAALILRERSTLTALVNATGSTTNLDASLQCNPADTQQAVSQPIPAK